MASQLLRLHSQRAAKFHLLAMAAAASFYLDFRACMLDSTRRLTHLSPALLLAVLSFATAGCLDQFACASVPVHAVLPSLTLASYHLHL